MAHFGRFGIGRLSRKLAETNIFRRFRFSSSSSSKGTFQGIEEHILLQRTKPESLKYNKQIPHNNIVT